MLNYINLSYLGIDITPRLEKEMTVKKMIHAKAVLLGVMLVASMHGNAAVINTDTSVTNSIPGLATFSTFGDMMDGMLVTATFNGNLSAGGNTQTLSWADIASQTGGVSGADWGLSMSNTTFGAPWTFVNGTGLGLTSLVLNGEPGLTLFDRTVPGPGTTGSAAGRDFTDLTAVTGIEFVATYSRQIKLDAAATAEGDLWHVLTISFQDDQQNAVSLSASNWSFLQDTDNDSRFNVPEPASLALIGLGLLGLGATRRRWRC